jgi:hypothetical protein
MTSEERPTRGADHMVVGIRMLVVAVLMFAAGAGGVVVVQGLLSRAEVSLSVRELVPFVFTIALGAASVTLAAVAMAMSRSAEDALVRRSDEGIRLQTETHVRTNEVLSQIQASTGVTEKRIEDIIAGRTGVVAKEVVARSLEKAGTPVSDVDADAISKALSEVLRSEVLPLLQAGPSEAKRRLGQIEAAQQKRHAQTKRWDVFRLSVLEALRAVPGVSIVSEARGQLGADSGELFWDIVVDVAGIRAGVDTHTREGLDITLAENGIFSTDDLRERYLSRFLLRAEQDKLRVVFLVLDKDVWSEARVRPLAEAIERITARRPDCHFVMLGGDPATMATRMVEEIRKHSVR